MNEELVTVLSARRYVYRLFQRLFGAVPEDDLFRAMDVELAREAVQIMGADEQGLLAVEKCLGIIEAAQGEGPDVRMLCEQLKNEYNRCFVGPRELPAPPFESVYRDRRRIIMTETTLSVRETYKASGFEPVLVHHVADDHVALELDFLAVLADRAVECALAGNEVTAREYLKTSKKFLAEHLGQWAGKFAGEMERLSGSELYIAAALALSAIVVADEAWL